MPYIGNQPYQGIIDSSSIADGSIQTGDLANSAVTAAKIADTGVTVAKLNSDVTQLIAQGGGPKITGVAITNSSWTTLDDTAVDTAGGYIKLTGTNFVTGCSVVVGTISATAVTFTSSTELRVQLPAQAAGTYILYVTNPDGGTAIRVNAVTYSATPSWVTSSTLPQQDDGVAISIQLSATSATTYALQAGSTLPSGLTLTSGGLLSGTVSGLVNDTSYSFTVVATDAELQDSPRAFTVNIAASDTYFNLTTLLINGDTAPNVLTDASSNNFNLIAYGDARASNFTPYATGWSNYFAGTGNALTLTSSADWAIGTTGTIEGWFYWTVDNELAVSNGSLNKRLWSVTNNSTNLDAYINNRNVYLHAGACYSTSANLQANTWYHIAVVYTSGTISIYVNGVSQGMGGTVSGYNISSTGTLGINTLPGQTPYEATGYVSNFRIVKGQALYTNNFTPSTTPLTTSSQGITGNNCVLLTCQSNRFIDTNSNKIVTRVGSTSVVSFNPFNITNTSISGSMYSVGGGASTPYVRAPASSAFLFTADFSVEMYIYTKATLGPIWGTGGSGAADQIYLNGTSGIYYDNTVFTYFDSKSSVLTNSWNHICITRQSNTLRIFINGILIGTKNQSATLGSNSIAPGIFNRGSNDDGPNNELYLSNLRVCNGSVPVEYQTSSTTLGTSVFNPPASTLTAVANTQLLTLQYRQPHNNHGFQDSSTNNHLITRSGNTSQGTFSPFSPNGWSNYFSGPTPGTNYLTLSSTNILSAVDVTTGLDTTYEFWVYPTSVTAVQANGYNESSIWSKGTIYAACIINSSGIIRHYTWTGTENYTSTPANSAPLNTWTHVAVVLTNNTVKIFINGQLSATGTRYAAQLTGQTFKIGAGNGSGAYPSTFFGGYISNFRVVTSALYSNNFTPSTSLLTLTADTQLLLAQDNRFINYAENNYGQFRYWRYVEGSTVNGHHPRVSRIMLIDDAGTSNTIVTYAADNCVDSGAYQLGTVTYDFGASNLKRILSVQAYHVTTADRAANYTVQYSSDNTNWTTAFSGVMDSHACGLITGTKANTITRSGDVRITSFSPAKPSATYAPATHGGSVYFDGTTDYLSLAENSFWRLGTNNFTIEAWIYLNNANPTQTLAFHWNGSSAGTVYGRTVIQSYSWNHVAVTRSGTILRFWVNGMEDSGTKVVSSTIYNNADPLYIGRGADHTTGSGRDMFHCGELGGTQPKWYFYLSGGGNGDFNGYMTGISISQSVKYTSNFTPALPTTTNNTSVLINATNSSILDSTGRNILETVGDSKVSTVQKKYGTGAMYFDGTGDYVYTSRMTPLGSGDFTIELWCYTTVIGANTCLFDLSDSGTSGFMFRQNINNSILVYNRNASTNILVTSNNSIATNVWQHIAVVRSAGTVTVYVNGVNVGSASNSINYTQTGLYLGAFINEANAPYAYTGYIDDLRITRYARYTGTSTSTPNFTPPAQTFKLR